MPAPAGNSGSPPRFWLRVKDARAASAGGCDFTDLDRVAPLIGAARVSAASLL